jgi:glycogen synthase
MRILTVGLLYPPHHLGGYELICEGVMQAASVRGHEVRVLVSDYRAPGVERSDAPGIHRTLRSYLDPTAQQARPLGPVQRLGLERANAAELERHIREFAPDVVSWWGMGGMSLSLIERVRRKGLPAVLTIQDPWLSYGFATDGWTRMARRLAPLASVLEPFCGIPIRYQLEAAGRYLFNSQHTTDAARSAGFEADDSVLLTPGVHRRFLSPVRAEPWSWRLLYVGRVHRDKGIDIAVAALARLAPDATLTIVGACDEEYAAELRRQAASLGLSERVLLTGPAPVERLPSVYADCDVLLFPVRWEEPWGLVPLEAMGIGRPVVATATGGAVTYLRDEENALLIGSEDPEALAQAVRRLAADEALRARLRAGGARSAEEHSAARYEQSVVDELEHAADGHGTRLSPTRPGSLTGGD